MIKPDNKSENLLRPFDIMTVQGRRLLIILMLLMLIAGAVAAVIKARFDFTVDNSETYVYKYM